MQPTISYLRVSSAGHGKSGLGIEAQRAAVARFADAQDFEVVAEYVEVETGKGADARTIRRFSRPRLQTLAG